MKSSSLETKTIRPGLLTYSFYRSNRQPVSRTAVAEAKPHRHHYLVTLVLLGILIFAVVKLLGQPLEQQINNNNAAANVPAAAAGTNHCSGNTVPQYMVVSVSQRHLWACEAGKTVYSTPVVTGIESLVADKTPRGTYQIYSKQTNTTLTGSDTTGSWSDPVHYWMPFLDNQYGTYGLHDATWRANSAFGHIDPNSSDASHGCVELPLGAAQWIYDWAQVGATVNVED